MSAPESNVSINFIILVSNSQMPLPMVANVRKNIFVQIIFTKSNLLIRLQ